MWCVKLIRCSLIAVLATFIPAHGTPALIVDAGPDQTGIGTDGGAFLNGQAGGTVPAESLTVRWSQVYGPASAVIDYPAELMTMVQFTTGGVYAFQLKASHGSISAVDTMNVTVHVSLPFAILRPAPNERIVIGRPYQIRWQMDLPVGCQVYYSLDDGITFTEITTKMVFDTFTWNVATFFKDSVHTGILKVKKYESPNAVTAGFVLVDSSRAQAGPFLPARSSSSPRVFIDRNGSVCVSGLRPQTRARLLIFDASGALLPDARASGRTHARNALLFYRIDSGSGTLSSGRILGGVGE